MQRNIEYRPNGEKKLFFSNELESRSKKIKPHIVILYVEAIAPIFATVSRNIFLHENIRRQERKKLLKVKITAFHKGKNSRKITK
jgi:hypothetical protein